MRRRIVWENCECRLKLTPTSHSNPPSEILKRLIALHFSGTSLPKAYRSCNRDDTHSNFVEVNSSWKGGGWSAVWKGDRRTSTRWRLEERPGLNKPPCFRFSHQSVTRDCLFFDRYLWQQLLSRVLCFLGGEHNLAAGVGGNYLALVGVFKVVTRYFYTA